MRHGYYNHPQIVKLLLDNGATRTTVNKYGCTPLDEAATPQIKQLFLRSAASVKERFSSDSFQETLEWVNLDKASLSDNSRMFLVRYNTSVVEGANSILDSSQFQSIPGWDQIKNFLGEARRTEDSKWLIKAYSAETGFYKAINEALAKGPSYMRSAEKKFHSYVGCLYQDPSLINFQYTGKSYRGLKMSREDFEKNYKVGNHLLFKAFTSTSKRRDTAEQFATAPPDSSRPLSVLCIYTVVKRVQKKPEGFSGHDYIIALDISSMSEFPGEEEVLILPYVSFVIQSITHLPSGLIEIELANAE